MSKGMPHSLAAAAPASATNQGPVKQAAFIPQLGAAPTQADFNGLLTKLIAAGIMASS
jgi:hypothetical protein